MQTPAEWLVEQFERKHARLVLLKRKIRAGTMTSTDMREYTGLMDRFGQQTMIAWRYDSPSSLGSLGADRWHWSPWQPGRDEPYPGSV